MVNFYQYKGVLNFILLHSQRILRMYSKCSHGTKQERSVAYLGDVSALAPAKERTVIDYFKKTSIIKLF